MEGDKYRGHLAGEAEINTEWRHGAPPSYELVNELFEQERTKDWPKGSLEEIVQNTIKTWEMEVSHKTRLEDFKSINPDKFTFSVNGRKPFSAKETLEIGSYNVLLGSSLPDDMLAYKSSDETFESSHDVFRSAFPRGFAWEVMAVYSGPPVITFKFRHWGHMEGSFKGHAPTGQVVEMFGVAIVKVDDKLRAEDIEIFYDPGELLAGLIKDPKVAATETTASAPASTHTGLSCPVLRH
ncbi:hypothetical protein LUZ61_005481 [Rhynchospora tenuis]|uniref:Pathogen-related protein n=1 Tax=Rhynchospora tenuis TaxID=198213 RepID=A0AAD5ZPP0_9POAL|nr:hypothetical protein LUZ61_005481 [Rhynchospora tenuis]